MDTKLKLGKKPATYDSRDLLFSQFRTAEPLPSHPKYFGHEKLVGAKSWRMLGNGPDDSFSPGFEGAGDCVFAGGDHETMLWTLESKTSASFTAANALGDYSAVTGYNPNALPNATGENPTDNGTDVREALRYRQKTGLLDALGKRHKIGAYVGLELRNHEELLEALYLFGIVAIGFAFPESAMDQFNAGKPWSVVPGTTIDGGHYVPLVAYRKNLQCVTWGRVQAMTWQFYDKYCDEAWAILSPEMLANGTSLEGFNLKQLQADLNALGV